MVKTIIYQHDTHPTMHNNITEIKSTRIYVRENDLFVMRFKEGELKSADSYDFEYLDGEKMHGEKWEVKNKNQAIEYFNEHHLFYVDETTTVSDNLDKEGNKVKDINEDWTEE